MAYGKSLNKLWSCKYGWQKKRKDLHVFMTFLCMISLKKKNTFFPSFDNSNDRICQERLRSRNVATMVTCRHMHLVAQ